MLLDKIKYRLILLLVSTISVTLIISGTVLHWTLRRSLETELGKKLEAVANGAAVYFDSQEIQFIGAGSRTFKRMTDGLETLRDATGVQRIYFFDSDGRRLLDTDTLSTAGAELFHLQFYQNEVEDVLKGTSSYSPLFYDSRNQPAMTGFAPLKSGTEIIGGVGVDGSVEFLESITALRRNLYLIGLIGIALAIIMAIITGRSITLPIVRLSKLSEKIAAGNYNEPVTVHGKGEPAVLASAMETMRQNILMRENDLKAMLAGIAHEIRNPLGGIELFTGILEDNLGSDHNGQDQLYKIKTEVKHLNELVTHFLEYARPRQPDLSSCDLLQTVMECTELTAASSDKSGISVKIVSENIPVKADPLHLRQIFLNILQNSYQAMPDDGSLEIKWEPVDQMVVIHITDTGHGISADNLEDVFTPFFTTRESGTGLGLSIVKNLIEQNNGSIRILRSDKNGTEFELIFQKS